MKTVQFTAIFWTLLLSVPLTALGLSIAAYATEHFNAIATSIWEFSRNTSISARGWVLQFSERWPEVAGMIIGQLVIMTILIFARRKELTENNQTVK